MLGERKTRGVFNEGKNSEWGSRMQELMPTQAAPVEPVAREPVEVVSKSADDLFFCSRGGERFCNGATGGTGTHCQPLQLPFD